MSHIISFLIKISMKILFSGLALLIFAPAQARVQPDLSWNFSGRTSPVGGTFEAQGGVSTPVLMGHIRPFLIARASTTPALRPGIEFYPVQFLGFSANRNWSYQFIDQPGMDCDANRCQLEIQSWNYSARVLARYGLVGGIFRYDQIDYDSFTGERNIVDGTNVVLLSPKRESAEAFSLTLNYQFLEELGFGVISNQYETAQTKEVAVNQLLYARYSIRDWSTTVGIGRTDVTARGVSAQGILVIERTIKSKLGY